MLLLTYSDLRLRLQACCMYQMTLCSLQEGRGKQGVKHKDSASRCLQQKPRSERPECELQASWVVFRDHLLLNALFGLQRESYYTASPGMHPILRYITHYVP